jgi:pilus assembly protein CpaC
MMVGGTQQVMLKVRFAEVSRSVTKELGSTIGIWDGSTSAGFDVADATIPAGEFFGGSTNGGELGFGFDIGSIGFEVLLQALEDKNLLRTIAEPNLVALSGQEASFLAGGEVPFTVTDDEGTKTTDFKPYGVELNFTPRVVDGNRINLELNASVSGIDAEVSGAAEDIAFTRRETKTTVEMMDGQSFAISGLLQDDFTDSAAQVPWLGDLPVLGALFRSSSYRRDQTELVVIITPHLVAPTRGEALALPTDRVRPPTEAELFLFGQTARPAGAPMSGPAAEVAKQDFAGSYGYVME